MDDSKRFSTLDALRGVAAILVMAFHGDTNSPVAVPGGYLAVDLFFALSGFVLALAYERRLGEGMALGRFVRNRLIRIYPMYLAGMLLGCAVYGWSLSPFLLLPDIASAKLLPANVPMWSLLAELVVNIAWAVLAVRLGLRGLVVLLLLSGSALAAGILNEGSADLGAFWEDAGLGMLRTVFSFGLGVALYRLRGKLQPKRRGTWRAWLLPLTLTAVLMFDPQDRAWWDLACIFALMPALIWLGTLWELPRPRIGEVLGDLSFPLYCLHGPIVLIVFRYGTQTEMTLSFAGLLVAAWVMDRWVDRPLRARLSAIPWPRRCSALA